MSANCPAVCFAALLGVPQVETYVDGSCPLLAHCLVQVMEKSVNALIVLSSSLKDLLGKKYKLVSRRRRTTTVRPTSGLAATPLPPSTALQTATTSAAAADLASQAPATSQLLGTLEYMAAAATAAAEWGSPG